MTEQFFGKELAARKIDAIPGLLEFDIPVHGDNRGWFRKTSKGKDVATWFSRIILCRRKIAK